MLRCLASGVPLVRAAGAPARQFSRAALVCATRCAPAEGSFAVSSRAVSSPLLFSSALRCGSARALSTHAPTTFTVTMPGHDAGRVTKWLKLPGDQVKQGEGLCQIETEKLVFELDSPSSGVFAKALEAAAVAVHPNDVIALLVSTPADFAAFTDLAVSAVPASPSARTLMLNNSVEPSKVQGTGKGGMITKADVLVAMGVAPAHAVAATAGSGARGNLPPSTEVYSVTPFPRTPTPASAPVPAVATAPVTLSSPVVKSAPAPASTAVVVAPPAVATASPSTTAPAPVYAARPIPGSFTDKKPSMVRKVISSRLTAAKAGVPHFYATIDCNIGPLLQLRKTLKSAGVGVSVNDVVVKAVAKALTLVPEVNCYWEPATGSVHARAGVDVAVAVATDGGLITPIVTAVDRKGLSEINDSIKDLAARARAGKLKPEEYQGGSFTISNLGMYNVDEFTAVINPPQACILAVGGGVSRAVHPEELGDVTSTAPFVATVMSLQMSCDRRVVDEALASQFLAVVRQFIQTPALLSA